MKLRRARTAAGNDRLGRADGRESIRGAAGRSLLIATLAFFGVAFAAETVVAEPSIAPSVARLFVGQEKAVQGVVTDSERDEASVRLRVGTSPQHLDVALVPGVLNSFPAEPEKYYLGKRLVVTGTIRDFRGVPEIVVRDPGQIRVLTESSLTAPVRPPAPVLAPAPQAARPAVEPSEAKQPGHLASRPAVAPVPAAEPTLRDLVERLSEQVKRLEERIQRLENQPASAVQP